MRRPDGLQKLLYLVILALSIYILYKGIHILVSTPAGQQAVLAGNIQRFLEDAAIRTWAPGYTATIEEKGKDSIASGSSHQIIPAYSYLADGQAEAETAEEMITPESTAQEAATEKETATEEETATAQEAATEKEAATEEETATKKEATTEGTIVPETEQSESEPERSVEAFSTGISDTLMEQLENFDYFLSNYYTVDGGTTADAELLDAGKLLGTDLRLEKHPEVPQILIYHTHSQEAFVDSREGYVEDTIVGMGETLAEILEKEYGYSVIHDTGVYDLVDGVLDRSTAYDYARDAVKKILEEYPSIEVIIDLHRDGVEGEKFVTEIDGKPTSRIMFFNGISRNNQNEPLTWLQNPYIEQNLAFSLQMQLAAQEKYPDFTRNIYLKAERFNLHLRPRSALIEAVTQLNTVEEERNAMAPIAEVLDTVLSGK